MRKNILVILALVSCTPKTSEKNINHQAIVLHNSMVKKANHIEHRLNEIKKDSAISRDSLALLSTLLARWKGELVEVPGNEDHDHAGHEHHHGKAIDLTDEQILEIQKELDERLSSIGQRVSRLKPENNDDQHIH
jgi:hypothetical protein